MSKWMIVPMLVSLLLAGSALGSDFCMWTLADSDMVTLRAGYGLSENIEGGFEYTLNTDSDAPGHLWGVYGVYIAPQAIDLEKIFSNDWIPPLTGSPYVGASMSLDFDGDHDNRTRVGPIAGIIVEDILVFEYFYQFISDNLDDYLNDEYILRIGLHFEF